VAVAVNFTVDVDRGVLVGRGMTVGLAVLVTA